MKNGGENALWGHIELRKVGLMAHNGRLGAITHLIDLVNAVWFV